MHPFTPDGHGAPDDTARVDQLSTEFPDFDIAREVIRDRIRYVSRRRRPGVQPHTVVTADLEELRGVLSSARTGWRAGAGPDG